MVKIAKEKDHSRSKAVKSKFSSGFTNHQQLKSPFSSQIHKMKLKASGSKVRRIPRSVPANLKESKKLKKFQENEEINLLKKQVQLMQEKLDSIEKAQRQLEASISTDGAASRSKDDDQASKKSKVEEEASKPSTSKRAKNIKRKRRNDSVDEDQLGNISICILLQFTFSLLFRTTSTQSCLHPRWRGRGEGPRGSPARIAPCQPPDPVHREAPGHRRQRRHPRPRLLRHQQGLR